MVYHEERSDEESSIPIHEILRYAQDDPCELRMKSLLIGLLLIVLIAGVNSAPAQGRQDKTTRAVRRDSLPVVEKVGLAGLKRMLQADSGKVVLLNAWASWCKPCKDEMPGLLKAWKSFRAKPLQLILLSTDDIDDLETKVRPALKKFGVDFPTYIMSDSSQDAFISGINDAWSGALPATFLYDREGKLAEMKVGERTYLQLREALDRLLRR